MRRPPWFAGRGDPGCGWKSSRQSSRSCHALGAGAAAEQPGELVRVVAEGSAELVVAALQAGRRTRDAERRDQLVSAVHGDRDAAQAQLELVDGGGPATPQATAYVAAQRVGVGEGGFGPAFERGRHGEAAPRVEDLAERRAVRWHVQPGPVAAAEQVARVDLRDLDDPGAATDAQVHRLAGLLADGGHG